MGQVGYRSIAVGARLTVPLPVGGAIFSVALLLVLVFSGCVCVTDLGDCCAFCLVRGFKIDIRRSRLFLFIFLVTATVKALIKNPVKSHVKQGCIV